METITLDGGAVCSRESAYELLAAALGLPDCWGRNLDALYDVLTERGTPVRLVVLRRELLEE
ncbi:MAG: barstar family protein, partial [Oscillospiraceae bacterium]|nr:barstar family protein [Oscillospiraceae bacterium]